MRKISRKALDKLVNLKCYRVFNLVTSSIDALMITKVINIFFFILKLALIPNLI